MRRHRMRRLVVMLTLVTREYRLGAVGYTPRAAIVLWLRTGVCLVLPSTYDLSSWLDSKGSTTDRRKRL